MSSILKKQDDSVNQSVFQADEDALETIHTIMHMARNLQMRGPGGSAAELNPMEAKVLGFFTRQPGATQRDLALHSGRDKGQLARLVNGLKERGLLLAQVDASDGRVMRLTLSNPARALYAQVQHQRKRLSAAAVDGLSESERSQLMVLLARIQSNLEAQR